MQQLKRKYFTPTVRPQLKKDMMNEADEEHHVAKLLIAELEQMDGSEEHYQAKFTVLSENIRHHIKEEESDMFSDARSLSIDFEALGNKLLARKTQLLKTGVPVSAEEKLMTKKAVRADSPARAANVKKPVKLSHKKSKKIVPLKKASSVKKIKDCCH